MHAFWSDGYEACSMQRLLQATGLPESSIYQTFGGRHALFTRCLLLYQKRSVARMTNLLDEAPSGMTFLRNVMNAVLNDRMDNDIPRGCFMMNTASELGQSDPEIAKVVNDSLTRFRGVFQSAVEQAQREGDIPIERDAAELAAYLVTCMSGLRTMVKAGADDELVKSTVEIMLGALH